MTLQEFIIRIRLQGGAAARQLRDILRQSDALKDSLNATGRAANKVDKDLNKVGKSASKNAGLVGKFFRNMRVGGGTSVGGVMVGGSVSVGRAAGALSSLGPFGAAIAGATVVVGGFALAASRAITALKQVEGTRAEQVITIDPMIRDKQGNVVRRKTVQEIDATRAKNASMAERRPEFNVRGQNVLRNVGVAEYEQNLLALMTAGFDDVSDAQLAAFTAVGRVAGKDVSIDDRAKMADIARRMAGEKVGAFVGKEFDAEFNKELARYLKFAADTKATPEEIIRSGPTAMALASTVGMSTSEVFAMMKANINAGTTRLTARDVNSALTDFLAKGASKANEDAKELGITLFDDNGQFKGVPHLIEQFRKAKESGKQIEPAITRLFGENGLDLILNLIKGGVEGFERDVADFTNNPMPSLEEAAAAHANTVTDAEKGVTEAHNSFWLAIEKMFGFGATWAAIMGAYSGAINWLTGLIADSEEDIANREAGIKRSGKFGAGRPTMKKADDGTVNAKKVTTAAEAKAAADSAATAQQQVIATAAKVEEVAASAQQKVAMFKPMLVAAQKFSVGMTAYSRAARFGVLSELQMMLAGINGLAAQAYTAGLTFGTAYSGGLAAGFANSPATAPARTPTGGAGGTTTTINNNNAKVTVNGVDTRKAMKTAMSHTDNKVSKISEGVRRG